MFALNIMSILCFKTRKLYRFRLDLVRMNSKTVVPYSQLTLCANWTSNVHNDRTYKEHRNLGIRKHVTTSCSGTKPFY